MICRWSALGLTMLAFAPVTLASCVGDPALISSREADGGTTPGAPDVATYEAGADATSSEAGADAGPCDLASPFANPTLVQGLNSTEAESSASLSPDELRIYVGAARADGGAGGSDLFFASRNQRADPFGTLVPLAKLDTNIYEDSPSISSDGRMLLYTTTGANYDLVLTQRAALGSDFDFPPTSISVNTSAAEITGFLTGDDGELLFASNRAGGTGGYDLYGATRAGTNFGAPTELTELDTPSDEACPVVSKDGLTIVWASQRADGSPKGGYDIWTASRVSKAAKWGSITNASSLNSPGTENPNWISPDGCRLYFMSDRAGSNDLYVAERGR